MPLDSTPRSLAGLIFSSPICAPTIASGATRPGRAFGAPHTICSSSPCPASTLHTCRRSASGWRTASTMRATTTWSRPSPSAVTSSTSRPMAVSTALSSSREAPVGTAAQPVFGEFHGVILVGPAHAPGPASSRAWLALTVAAYANCFRNRTSFSKNARRSFADAVAQHCKALHAHAEGEAGVALRVDADVAQHVRMDHAAAEHFQPAGAAIGLLPGDVHFRARLNERK